MWNFGVYSDNINDAISHSVGGIVVGNELFVLLCTWTTYLRLMLARLRLTLLLQAISVAGTFNSYKLKPSKCRIVGSDIVPGTKYTLGKTNIELKNCGLLLGAVIDGRGIHVIDHVKRRAKMVDTAIKSIKSWRTMGLSFRFAYKHLFLAKVIPRFTYAFGLIGSKE